MTTVQATRCPVCRLLVDPGEYGSGLLAAPSYHLPHQTDDGWAVLCESAKGACKGSQQNGRVETVAITNTGARLN